MSDFFSKVYRGLGTRIELRLLKVSGGTDFEILDKTNALIEHYEALFTVNREQSELMALNHGAGVTAVQLSEEVYKLTKKAVQVSQEHFGFNASIGPLVKLWHIGFADARVPSEREIQKVLRLTRPDGIILNDQEHSVYLPEKGMALDLGGIAKGYIADRLAEFWKGQGISTGIINLGGNVLFLGQPLKGNWRVGIRNPLEKDKGLVLQVLTKAQSSVTSGIDQRYFKAGEKTYHHILHPETGYPHENNLASVTVFSTHAIDGEIEAKRLFFADKPEEVYPQNRPDIQGAVLISKDKKIKILGLKPKDIRIIDKNFSRIG